MTSECQPNQVHTSIVNRSIPVRIIPDLVSSSPSDAVAYSMPSTVWDVRLQELATYKQQNNGSTNFPRLFPTWTLGRDSKHQNLILFLIPVNSGI
jgi:hypothetical protein